MLPKIYSISGLFVYAKQNKFYTNIQHDYCIERNSSTVHGH